MTEQVESPLVAHARRELERIGEDFIEPQLRVVRAFAEAGHSGASAAAALAQLERLLRFENLAPLTDDPSEWIDHTAISGGEPTWQSTRNPQAFSQDGGKTYYLLDEAEEARRRGEPRPMHTSESWAQSVRGDE